MTYLISIALLTLFTAFKIKTGLLQIRPFDGLVAVMLLWTLAYGTSFWRSRLSIGFVILLPYFFWHALSALTYEFDNGLREGLQISILLAFAYVVMIWADRIDYAKAGGVILLGLVAITIFNIGWHIEHGYWTGWKRLNDPKAAFNFLPMALTCLVVFAAPAERRFHYLMLCVLAVVILLSGERKALIIFGVLMALLAGRGRVVAALPLLGAGILALSFYASASGDAGYVADHLQSLLDPTADSSYLELAKGGAVQSLSNAQRSFALDLSSQLFWEQPFFGVGTNVYEDMVRQHYAYLPDYMLLGIHSEPLRVLTENGIVGLLLYGAVWLVALMRLGKVIRHFLTQGLLNAVQARMLPFILLLPPFFYVATEAPGTHSFVCLVFVSMSPNFVYWAVLQRARRFPGEVPAEADFGQGAGAVAEPAGGR
ncbi:MAG TPA: O-antigen ligase family protein [Parvibaculum sp.]|jgi:hypothetical protein